MECHDLLTLCEMGVSEFRTAPVIRAAPRCLRIVAAASHAATSYIARAYLDERRALIMRTLCFTTTSGPARAFSAR
jgi:hypothetical protein